MYLLDTDTFSAIVNQRGMALKRAQEHSSTDIKMSAIAHGEVMYGVHANPIGSRKLERIQFFFRAFETLAMPPEASEIYGCIRAGLEKIGQPIGPNDFWIAAHALSLDATLVTNNVREFKRIKGLKVENWLQ
jgi:tRNA(fMet)-specific endonuclease VapC